MMENVRYELLTIGEWDWFTARRLRAIHHVETFDDIEAAEDDWGGPGVAACGVRADWWRIPGIFTRMGARRCRRCCKVLGYPNGIGSPKNDDACRPLVEQRIAAPSHP